MVLVAVAAALAAPADQQAASLAAPLRLVLQASDPAVVGQQYRYEACRPAPTSPNQCGGPSHHAITPSGGSPPYAFFTRGFLPSGLRIDTRTGVLSGRPAAGTDRRWRFEICARDLSRMQACAGLTLVVRPRFDGHYCGTTHVEVTAAAEGVNVPPVILDRPLDSTLRQGMLRGGLTGQVIDAAGHASVTIPLPGGQITSEEQFAPDANGVMAVHGRIDGEVNYQGATVVVRGRFDATRTEGACGR